MTKTTAAGAGGVLGVLGGMGPLASAEFMKTIYEYSGAVSAREQQAPAVVLYSDPAFPDRTDSFLNGGEEAVRRKLIESLERLCDSGATRIVICCMTIHHLLPGLPAALRERVVSLPDVILARLEEGGRRHLMVCSNGTRKLEIFERHERWARAKEFVVFPEEAHQRRLHELIYEVKQNRGLRAAGTFVESLLALHGLDAFVAGCSEIHLLAKHMAGAGARRAEYSCLDPLAIIARQLAEQSIYEA
jgi:aspartate racemase